METPASLDPHLQLAIEVIGGFFLFSWSFPRFCRLVLDLWYFCRRFYWFVKRLLRWASRTRFFKRRFYNDEYRRYTPRKVTKQELRGYVKVADEKFKPWKEDYLKALLLCAAGVFWIGSLLFLYDQNQNPAILACAMPAVFPLYAGFSYLDSALNRKRGKAIEKEAIKRFAQIHPSDWDIVPLPILNGIGDIDLPVRLQNDELCLIEIKPWHRWNVYFRGVRALRQVKRQRRAVRASYGLIWLPCAKKTYAELHNGVLVVGGHARFLIEKIGDIVSHEAIIKFPQKPPDDLLSYIKAKRFRWNKHSHHWEGKCNARDFKEMRAQIADEGGMIAIVEHPPDI